MRKGIIALLFMTIIGIFLFMAEDIWGASIIGQYRLQFQLLSADNGYENFDYIFTKIDDTHTKVSLRLKPTLDKATVYVDLAKQGDITKLPVSKTKGTGVSVDVAEIKLDDKDTKDIDIVITHPKELQEGYEIKIGYTSATIGTTTSTGIFTIPSQHSVFYDNSNYWIIFWDGSNSKVMSSSDGTTWGNATNLINTNNLTGAFGNRAGYASIAYVQNPSGQPNRGWGYITLASDGTSSVSKTNIEYGYATLNGGSAFDTSNNVLTCEGSYYYDTNKFNIGSSLRYTLSKVDPYAFPIPLDDQDVLYVYSSGNSLYSRLWDNSTTTMGGEVTIESTSSSLIYGYVKQDNQYVWLIYRTAATNGNLVLMKYDKSSDTWADQSANVVSSQTVKFIGLSIDKSNNYLYCFYDKNDNKIYYKVYNGSSWGSETNFVTDTTAKQNGFSVFPYKANNKIGVAWCEGSSSPYNVMVEFLDLTPASTDTYSSRGVGRGIARGIGR